MDSGQSGSVGLQGDGSMVCILGSGGLRCGGATSGSATAVGGSVPEGRAAGGFRFHRFAGRPGARWAEQQVQPWRRTVAREQLALVTQDRFHVRIPGFRFCGSSVVCPFGRAVTVRQSGGQIAYTNQRMGLTFGLPRASVSTNSTRWSLRTRSRIRSLIRRMRVARCRSGKGRLNVVDVFIQIPFEKL